MAPPPSTAPFAERLLAWYRDSGRKTLPWKQPAEPYRVWLSEIMLQQTQVGTVIPYFERFVARFPDLAALAAAELDDVLALWSGLGYYARARNLHRAAREVLARHGGRLPENIEALQTLPGIGRSTAGAILALARGQRHAILDGNVRRVLARHRGVEGWPGARAVEQRLWAAAEALTPEASQAADYTQAIMDLGALMCTRARPRCEHCPVAGDCVARASGRQRELPAPRPRRALPQRTRRFLLLRDPGGAVLLERRAPSGLWGGLWSLPECALEEDLTLLCRSRYALEPGRIEHWPTLRHVFSHYALDIEPALVEVRPRARVVREGAGAGWYTVTEARQLGLAAPVKELLRRLAARDRPP